MKFTSIPKTNETKQELVQEKGNDPFERLISRPCNRSLDVPEGSWRVFDSGHHSSKDMPVSGRIAFLLRREGKIEAQPLESSRFPGLESLRRRVLKLIMKKILETIEHSYDT